MYLIEDGFVPPVKNFISEEIFYSSIENPRWKPHYQNLINRAKNRTIEGYTENHHIVPKCLGGSNEDENFARLTAEEHYVAHQLLAKMFPENRKLIWAILMMTVHNSNRRTNNKLFGWAKRKIAKINSEVHKGNTYCLGKKLTEEHKYKLVKARVNRKPSLGMKHTEENKLKWSKNKKGIMFSEEHKLKIGLSNKGKVRSEECKDNLRNYWTGKKHSEEHKAKISEGLRGRKNSPETIAKRVASIKLTKQLKRELLQKVSL